jgi:hypothetical protein
MGKATDLGASDRLIRMNRYDGLKSMPGISKFPEFLKAFDQLWFH